MRHDIETSAVVVGERCRKDLGDVQALADSMRELGQLQPIVLTPDNELVAGERRLRAAELLGWERVKCVVVDNLEELSRHLKAEEKENTCRKDLLPSEVVASVEKQEKQLAIETDAKRRTEEGKKRGGETAGRGRPKQEQLDENFSSSYSRERAERTTRTKAAAGTGMSGPTFERAKKVVEAAKTEPEKYAKLQEEMDRTGKVNGAYKKLVVAQKSEEIAKEPPPLPTGPFRVIVCDPPWQYDARENDPTHRSANPYPSMSLDAIKALPVGSLALDDCVLWLWTTNAHIPEAFAIVAGWGFNYKTILTWAKHRMGTGDWLRGQTEHCLLCVRGKPTIRLTNQTTLLLANAGEHSAKPEEFYALVEALCPGSKLEMFQRRHRDGWEGHGDESGSKV